MKTVILAALFGYLFVKAAKIRFDLKSINDSEGLLWDDVRESVKKAAKGWIDV